MSTEVVEYEVIVTGDNTVEVVSAGIQGPPGPPGASGDKNFEQAFTNQSTVVVTHNLGKRPSVAVFDSSGDEVEGAVTHNSDNQLTVVFSASFSGTVMLN